MGKAYTAVALCAVTFLALGGVAYASIPDPDGLIHGCYRNTSGDMRVIDSEETCQSNETPLNWQQAAPAGFLLSVSYTPWSTSIPAGSTSTVIVECPSGAVPPEDRFALNSGLGPVSVNVHIERSEPRHLPLHSTPGWRVTAQNTGPDPEFLGGTLICATR
jgi:hypothetical protein